ncbi:MAG TPA: 16S rRNA (cytosine(1402)-N(4))-methyltransferase RsmH [Bacteroidota bacterium]|nr:16S rRNA (cytosine(1402)-N(4))-methyltransferase RsmH [Bacteroidota bacterium]
MAGFHESVLREEVIHFLVTDRGGTYVDGTVGGGGHAESICRALTAQGRLIGFDRDSDALGAAEARLSTLGAAVTLIRGNFADMAAELRARGVTRVAGIFLDLGVSSHQLDAQERGFSFRPGSALDMRMDTRATLSAREVVNTYSEERLAEILRMYGEERAARRIARGIVKARPVESADDLAAVVRRSAGGRFLTKSLARVFQGIRIEVNGELESLRHALQDVPDLLERGGRCVVISYHSLEDRIVKEFFRGEAADTIASAHKLLPDHRRSPRLVILTRKPVGASEGECARNTRARSAKLRAAERV